jgi:hypothetical protein
VRLVNVGVGAASESRRFVARQPFDGEPLSIALGSPQLSQCGLQVEDYTGSLIDIAYTSLPGNQPQKYGDIVALWESSVIPWAEAPIKKVPVPDNDESGTMAIDQLDITRSNYILGYGVGPSETNICASAVLGAGGLVATQAAVSISTIFVGTTSVSVHYETLSGYLPHTNNNWVALWAGDQSPYSAPKPLATAQVPEDVNIGDLGINGVSISIATTYTLAYFMGPALTSAAALLTFTTAP